MSYGVAMGWRIPIKGSLKEKFGIDTAFYVDGDKSKVDGKMVLSPEYLDGKSGQYYVVVPIAFYSAVKEQLVQGGTVRI